MIDAYADYVEHPRYGRGPRLTGLDLPAGFRTLFQTRVHLHWRLAWSPRTKIDDTGIRANTRLQAWTAVPVTHYFDEDRVCETCGRRFIFFAEEQKHWYEELHFNVSADCVECVECRKERQGYRKKQRRYEALHALEPRTDEQSLEMADLAMDLVEAGTFGPGALEQAGRALNLCSESCKSSAAFRERRRRMKITVGPSSERYPEPSP